MILLYKLGYFKIYLRKWKGTFDLFNLFFVKIERGLILNLHNK